jgi:hypothetical protein
MGASGNVMRKGASPTVFASTLTFGSVGGDWQFVPARVKNTSTAQADHLSDALSRIDPNISDLQRYL